MPTFKCAIALNWKLYRHGPFVMHAIALTSSVPTPLVSLITTKG